MFRFYNGHAGVRSSYLRRLQSKLTISGTKVKGFEMRQMFLEYNLFKNIL
jgi:hypothetical protein